MLDDTPYHLRGHRLEGDMSPHSSAQRKSLGADSALDDEIVKAAKEKSNPQIERVVEELGRDFARAAEEAAEEVAEARWREDSASSY
jgi:hypothetical protein